MMGLPGGSDYTPPVWTTPETVSNLAMGVMRLDASHPDASRVLSAATTAISLVDDYLDRADDPLHVPPPEPVMDATVKVCVEVYKRKDAPFGVLNSWSDSDIGPVRIGTDALKGVESQLFPFAHRGGAW